MAQAISQYRVVTPCEAQDIITNKLWDKQRSLRQGKVDEYVNIMKRGEWEDGSQLRFGMLDGSVYLLDGQHRCAALVKSKTSQIFSVITQQVDDERGLARIYASIDRGLSRSPADQMHALGIDLLFGWNSTELNIATSAVKFMVSGFDTHSGQKSPSSRGFTTKQVEELLTTYAGSIGRYFGLMSESSKVVSSSLKRRATMALGIVLFEYSAKALSEKVVMSFWDGAASGDGLSKGDPRKLAFQHLATVGMTGGGQLNGAAVSAEFSARYLAQCFNKWSEDKTAFLIRLPPESDPIVINGSPFDGTVKAPLYKP